MSRGDFPFVSEKAQVYFKDIYDHLFRIVEVADNHRETMNVILQVYVSMVSNQLNHTMRVLTRHRDVDAAADGDHRHLWHEFRFHAGTAMEVRISARASVSWPLSPVACLLYFPPPQLALIAY